MRLGIHTGVCPGVTSGKALSQLWNGASVIIRVVGVHVFADVATKVVVAIKRTTARGTQGSTVAATTDHVYSTPQTLGLTGVTADKSTFSVEPTKVAGLGYLGVPATIGAGMLLTFDEPIELLPSAGVCLDADGTIGDATVVWILDI
jgi:hypothetical protein